MEDANAVWRASIVDRLSSVESRLNRIEWGIIVGACSLVLMLLNQVLQ